MSNVKDKKPITKSTDYNKLMKKDEEKNRKQKNEPIQLKVEQMYLDEKNIMKIKCDTKMKDNRQQSFYQV